MEVSIIFSMDPAALSVTILDIKSLKYLHLGVKTKSDVYEHYLYD